jgi:ferritin-like metal-binding protein YciE
MRLNSLDDLYLEELKDLYNAETQLVKALPKMARTASSPDLRRAFEEHLTQTKGQVKRLEEIFQKLGERPEGKRCIGMQGLVAEGEELIENGVSASVLDAALIMAAQKAEHYEIAGYGTVRTYASLLGDDEAAQLLQETLDEEGAADKKLSQLAEQVINLEAADGTESEDDDEDEEEDEEEGEEEDDE